MKRTSIFFRSELFQPDQREIDYAQIQKHDLIFTNSLCDFLNAKVSKVGYEVGTGEISQRSIYTENCQQLRVKSDAPFDMWILCGSYLDGHWALVYPEQAIIWKRFKPYKTDPFAQRLFEAIVKILDKTEGISELEFGFSS